MMAHATNYPSLQSWQALEIWHAHMPKLVADTQGDAFSGLLDQALQALVPFDQSCVFFYPAAGQPSLLHDNLQDVPEEGAMQRYINGTYLLDPVYTACADGRAAGLYRMAELAPDDFFTGEYFNSPDVHPCISMASGSLAEEIVFLSPLPGGAYAAYSLMRCNGSAVFSASEMAILRLCQPVLEALCQRHYAQLAALPEGGRAVRSIADQLEAAFAGFAADRLTAREQAIVGLILRGHSSLSIALNLDIAEGTVKNHRKHLYSKLGVGSQSELFHMFVNHLLVGEQANVAALPQVPMAERRAGA